MKDTEVTAEKARPNGTVQFANVVITPTIDRTESVISPSNPSATETRGAHALAPVIDIDRLYEGAQGTSSQIVRALELLKQASDNMAEAQKCDNAMESDRYVQRVQLALPKLFALRTIGDGFGLVINSIHFAFSNLRGKPLASNQLNVIWRTLRELRARPVMSLEQGIQRVEELEAQGLDVDPSDISELIGDSEAAE